MARADVTPIVEHDASKGYSAIAGVHESNTPRTLSLEIRRNGDGFHLYVQTDDPTLHERLGAHLEDELQLDLDQLAGAVRDCRQVWHEALVHRTWPRGKVFQKYWDLAADDAYMRAAMPELALAGSDLWRALFFPRDAADPKRYESLRHIGNVLREELETEGRWLRVSAEGFYVPWALVYAGDLDLDGSDWRPEGFWGYQHLIEHAPLGSGNLGNELKAPGGGPVVVGLQIDELIDVELDVDCVKPVVDLLDAFPGHALTAPRRVKRQEVAQALRNGPLLEQVLFFCCHAEQDGIDEFRFDQAYLQLSDRANDPRRVRITPSLIERWIDRRTLANDGRRPLVFLNACGSGQLNSIFYPSFGETFLKLGACSVVGAQVELPAVFAGEFARRFLERFLAGGEDDHRGGKTNTVGRILYELRREFLDRHNNPLGLIYSVFRGADTYLDLSEVP